MAAERPTVGIGLERSAREPHCFHSTAASIELLDGLASEEAHAAAGRTPRELRGELVRVARFVRSAVDAAEHAFLRILQRRLQRFAFGCSLQLPRQAERAHLLGVARQRLEVRLPGREVQNAARKLVIADAGLASQRPEALEAV